MARTDVPHADGAVDRSAGQDRPVWAESYRLGRCVLVERSNRYARSFEHLASFKRSLSDYLPKGIPSGGASYDLRRTVLSRAEHEHLGGRHCCGYLSGHAVPYANSDGNRSWK